MSFKGISAVSLFLGLMLIASSGSLAPSSFDWISGPVVSGGSVDVKVSIAPCHPLTVTLTIGSYSTSVRLLEAPGEVSLPVPAGTEGQQYTITVSCPDDRDTHSGSVT
jgi:hypothetical protein